MIKRFLFCVFSLLLALSISVFPHSGGTDSRGGHHVGGTSEYHYHHGKPAHQHPGGVCPYASNANKPKKSVSSSSGKSTSKQSSSSASTPKVKQSAKQSPSHGTILATSFAYLVGGACVVAYFSKKR